MKVSSARASAPQTDERRPSRNASSAARVEYRSIFFRISLNRLSVKCSMGLSKGTTLPSTSTASCTGTSVIRPMPLRKSRVIRSGHHPMRRIHRPWKKFFRGKLYPWAASPPAETTPRMAACVSGGMRSSASRTSTQGSRQRSMAACFCLPKPFQSSMKTSQPKPRAISGVPSSLPESTTTTWPAKATLSRQPVRLAASFFVMIETESGIFSSMVHLSRRSHHAGRGHHTTEDGRIKTVKWERLTHFRRQEGEGRPRWNERGRAFRLRK